MKMLIRISYSWKGQTVQTQRYSLYNMQDLKKQKKHEILTFKNLGPANIGNFARKMTKNKEDFIKIDSK